MSVDVPPVSIPTLIPRPPRSMGAFKRRGRTAADGRCGSAVGGAVVVDAGLLLAGQLLDRRHHPVGDLSACTAGGDAVVLPAYDDRLAEADRHADQPWPVGPDRLQAV